MAVDTGLFYANNVIYFVVEDLFLLIVNYLIGNKFGFRQRCRNQISVESDAAEAAKHGKLG